MVEDVVMEGVEVVGLTERVDGASRRSELPERVDGVSWRSELVVGIGVVTIGVVRIGVVGIGVVGIGVVGIGAWLGLGKGAGIGISVGGDPITTTSRRWNVAMALCTQTE